MSLEPTLQSVLASTTLRWVFVGGKGGVGKTTTACALATCLAKTPRPPTEGTNVSTRRVLIVSTDPAHNVSDAFDQPVGNQPSPIHGVNGLDAMELDSAQLDGLLPSILGPSAPSQLSENLPGIGSIFDILKQSVKSFPGIDEVAVLLQLLSSVKQLNYDVVVFDTAPTGHTLRLLSLPHTLTETLDQLLSVEGLGSMLKAASQFLQPHPESGKEATLSLSDQLVQFKERIAEVQTMFSSEATTTFICVCIPEFLSVYETERLIQELMKYDIACQHIVVNQLVKRPSAEPPCRMCASRVKIQAKYMAQVYELYEDFHLVEMPLLSEEVRGVSALERFSHFLLTPYDPDVHGYL